jgi:D-glycerate 3-kinase
VFLQVPNFDAVRRWRAEQEMQLPKRQRMSAAKLRRFTAHYERLTYWMLRDLPSRADLTVVLDDDHAITTSAAKSRR